MVPTPELQLEDGSRIINERQATERWLRFASERHDGQPTSATVLLETNVCKPVPFLLLRYDRSGSAHRFLMG